MKTLEQMWNDLRALILGTSFSKHSNKNSLEALQVIITLQILQKLEEIDGKIQNIKEVDLDELKRALYTINGDMKEIIRQRFGLEI